jgi:2-alkyl-3-oxoalkanoate reductase
VTRRRPRLTRYAVSQLGLERTLNLDAARAGLGFRPAPSSLEGAETW